MLKEDIREDTECIIVIALAIDAAPAAPALPGSTPVAAAGLTNSDQR